MKKFKIWRITEGCWGIQAPWHRVGMWTAVSGLAAQKRVHVEIVRMEMEAA